MIPGVTLILNGCGLGAKGSDEIGRIGAKLSTTNIWTSDEVQQDEARIQWKDLWKNVLIENQYLKGIHKLDIPV